jgi:hypothetical protein
MPNRTLDELTRVDEPAWPLVESWIRKATHPVEVLPATSPQRGEALVATQVSTRSPLGAVIYETGGLLVDHGWLRILGSGHPRLSRSAPRWNFQGPAWTSGKNPYYFLVADDALGGFYALDGGGLGSGKKEACYFAPDSLRWENMAMGYTDFRNWCLTGDVAGYYAERRWNGWESEVAALHGDQAISVVPYLFTKGPPMGQRSRRPVLIAELFEHHLDLARQFDGIEGTPE